MKYSKAITLIALVISIFALIAWMKPHRDFLIKNEIINGPYEVKYEIKDNRTELSLSCAMGPYVGVDNDGFREASVSDLKNNIRNFGKAACSNEYVLKKTRAKILTLNPGEYYRMISTTVKCTNRNRPHVDAEPQKLCRSLLNFDVPIF